MEKEFQYYAFISYKREDEKWAKWLHRKLEHYRLPSIIASANPHLPRHIKVFKDTTDINPGVLAEELSQNLEKSKYLIVICSPLSAKSVWVGKEISNFIALGKQNQIILFIVDGKPYSDNPAIECYHSMIKEELPEMLGVNINEAGKEWKYIKKQKAFIRVVSALLNVSFDSLWKRQKRRIIRNWAISVLGMVLFSGALFGVSMYQHQINKPFDVSISLIERTAHNPNLPIEKGMVKLCLDKDIRVSDPIYDLKGAVKFRNIPGYFLEKPAHLLFTMFGFYPIDTVVNLNQRVSLSIQRDSVYSKIQGFVRDEKTDRFLSGVTVETERIRTITNHSGYFRLIIPLNKQKTVYPVILSKGNHLIKEQSAYPTKNENTIINTLYFK